VEGKGKTDWNFAHARRPFDTDDWDDLKAHQPFFAQVNFEEAHRIYHKFAADPTNAATVRLPPYLADDPLVREDWAAYLDAIGALDVKVGAVLKLLEAEGMAENTVVMFMGDNGREDFRGKYHLYEQGCSVPLIVRAAGVEPGSVSDELIGGVDIAAATLAVAGIALPAGFHGRPFMGPHRQPRPYLFSSLDRIDDNFDRVRAVRDARWKYLRNFEPDRPYLQVSGYRSTTNPTYLAMRKLHAQGRLNAAQNKFMASSRPEEELYDLEADPYELNNLASLPANADVLARLRGQLEAWMHLTGDDRHRPESKASVEFSLKRYAAGQPRTLAKNLQELRENYKNLSEVEPIVPDKSPVPATPDPRR
jgi:arylsulfatase A-like enzyme